MMAALFLRGPSRWRSMQLYAALSVRPTNHWACGSFHSRTRSHLRNQVSAPACSAQKPSGSSAARFHSASYSAALLMCAWAANSAGGGNCRVSLRTLVMLVVGEDIGVVLHGHRLAATRSLRSGPRGAPRAPIRALRAAAKRLVV